MKWIAMIQTRDGKLHPTVDKATRHAEKVYGEALSNMAHKVLLHGDKYMKLQDFIDTNLDGFVALQVLKQDIILEKTDLFGAET